MALGALAVAALIGYTVLNGGLTGFEVLSDSAADAGPVHRDSVPLLALFWSGLKAGLIAGTTLALLKVSLTGPEALALFALVLAVLFASKARLVIPAVIAAAALWGLLSLSFGH